MGTKKMPTSMGNPTRRLKAGKIAVEKSLAASNNSPFCLD
jgi:hypothetical protein